jgi:uncharacterized protein
MLIAHYAGDPRVDIGRCGVTGFSLGGYASYLLFARLPQMLAAVPMMGLPCFSRRWQDIVDETTASNPEWAAALAPLQASLQAHADLVRQIDPYDQLKQAPPRALLMMNGDFDADQPRLYALDAYRDLLPCYAGCPENLQLRIYPAGHTVTPDMEQDAVEWLARRLIGPADAGQFGAPPRFR